MREHDRINRFFAPLAVGEAGGLGLMDDAALLQPPEGFALVITTDSVIEGIHILPDATPQQFAQKLIRRNLSDLAAMGATPWRYTLNLHTPRDTDDAWFAAFAAELEVQQTSFRMVLVGGDSTSGFAPIHTSLTCFGLVPQGKALQRNGAQAGDDLYVSGTIGDAAHGLKMLLIAGEAPAALSNRYHCPEPRIALGEALRDVATAAIDVSDGLLQDIDQLCRASKLGAQFTRNAIPLSMQVQQLVREDAGAWDLVLAGGDDYELAFTAPFEKRAAIAALGEALDLRLTRIGIMTEEPRVVMLDEDGEEIAVTLSGWDHA